MILLEKISKKYAKNYAIKDITLNFKSNETVAIIGPSGSGKSTLLRCINHLEELTSGQIFINGKKLVSKDRKKLCLKIGMVFQNFNLFPHMNVRDNLIYSPINVLGLERAVCEAKAENLLEQFSLKQRLTCKPADLSGGQKQRVAIVRALMMDPEVMLFDEPTSALDPEVIKDIIEAISLLRAKMTMIVVTHHIRFAKAIADRIVFMDHGQVLADQPITEFFQKPKSHRARLFLENVGDLM
jgi:polar amino acid transport system ATP-binding protein